VNNFNVTLSYRGVNENFAEVMASVATGLRAAGKTVTETNGFQGGVENIIFGFYINPAIAQKRSIIYQLEPVADWTLGQTWGNIPSKLLQQHLVWDYSRYNIDRLKEAGVDARYVPIGFTPGKDRIEARQDIDVLFYGAVHERRRKIMEGLKRARINAQFVFGVFGGRLDDLIARSKVVLNLHGSGDFHTFESVRVAGALSRRKAVVSEVNIGDDTDGFNGAVLGVPYPSLVDACVFLVRNAERRAEYADAGFEYVKTRDIGQIMGVAVEETYGPQQ
jgi:hypothetical protein